MKQHLYRYSWKHVMKAFEYKYRVVAIDMRGYNKSDKPRGIFLFIHFS